MTLLVENPVPADTPAVHALIVSVGEYTHLDGGAVAPAIDTAGMGQLSSPPLSAMKLANWLMSDLRPRNGILGTIEILCSGPSNFLDAAGAVVVPDRATLNNLRQAVTRWYARGAASKDNILIFYFCGHGVTSGAVDSLLLEDFGGDALDPFNVGAVDATAFSDGMRKCPVQNQLFLFDACRTAPQTYLREYGTQRGVPLVSAAQHINLGQVNQVCLWASELGLPAYGRIDAASVFIDAFLASMHGASAVRDAVTAAWEIQAARLTEGVNAHVSRILGKERQYVTPTRMSIGFPLHVLVGEPLVPVDVACKPMGRASQIQLRCTSGHTRPAGIHGPWQLDLPYGIYKVEALEDATGAVLDTQSCPASPPSTTVVVSV